MTDRDVVLVTIDCWRDDALQRMPSLRERVERDEYTRGSAICAAPATRGAFAAVHAGQYYPQVYRGYDDVDTAVEPLASVLSDAGYATGGFVGSNPFLTPWARGFDRFWNDDMEFEPGSPLGERVQSVAASARHAASYLRMRGRVPAAAVGRRAREWYESRDRPRFLWLHLMDSHAPYLPGVRRGLAVGPLSVYLSHWRFNRDPDDVSAADRRRLRRCYHQSLSSLDAQFDDVLGFVDDDAVVAVVGDHGEEFDHGVVGHTRLYDETVKVPLLAKGLSAVADGDVVRQLDLPATLLSALGLEVPDGWEGEPHDGTHRDAFMVNHSPRRGRTYAGLRTDRYKLIRTADADTGELLRREAYDFAADPGETEDVSGERDLAGLRRRLRQFRTRPDIEGGVLERPRGETSATVEHRLEALGYK